MANFDFTQFISFDSILSYNLIQNNVEEIFGKKGFLITGAEDIESVKMDYYSQYLRKYTFELKKDDFLDDFMEWRSEEKIPQPVVEFIELINKTLKLDISKLCVIICSFADKDKTCNEFVCTNIENIYKELFKMSPFSYICPENLIINIR